MEKRIQQGEEGGEDDPSPLYILSLSSSLSSPSSENMKLSPTSLHTPFENINIENMTKEICLQRGQLLPNQVFCSERSFKLQQLNDTWLFGFLLNSIFTPASRTTAYNWNRNLPNQVSDPWNSRKQQAAFLKQVSLCTACIKLKLYRSKFTKWRKPKHLVSGHWTSSAVQTLSWSRLLLLVSFLQLCHPLDPLWVTILRTDQANRAP